MTITLTNLLQCDYVIIKNSGESFRNEMKSAEGVSRKLAVKYRTIDEDGHVLGGPFYYIENGMGVKFRWLAKIFAFFGAGVGLFGIGTFYTGEWYLICSP